MFMTLRASKEDSQGSSMRQIAATDAHHGGAGSRAGIGRRMACIQCQRKKVRCTGSKSTCDRCESRKVPCVPARRSRKTQNKDTQPGELTHQESQDVDINQGIRTPDSLFSASTPSPQPLSLFPTPEVAWQDVPEILTLIPTPEPVQQDIPEIPALDLVPATPSTSIPQHLPQIQQPQVDGAQCSCIENLLDQVQKLDDDEYRLRTLAFDQVLKLQKYLLFQCLQPMECASCVERAHAHILILIICERVTNMFQCLSRRLSNIQPKSVEEDPARVIESYYDGSSHSFFSFRDPDKTTPADLDVSNNPDAGIGEKTTYRTCNAEMFSDSFKEQYSAEEQFHMIQALARLQRRNLKQLLARVGDMPQSQKSQARMAKIRTLNARLDNAANIMEQAFQAILDTSVF